MLGVLIWKMGVISFLHKVAVNEAIQFLVHSKQSINAGMSNSSIVAVIIVITTNQIHSSILAQRSQACP